LPPIQTIERPSGLAVTDIAVGSVIVVFATEFAIFKKTVSQIPVTH
jgi:hypothetical protein